jgi:hypothetical protein
MELDAVECCGGGCQLAGGYADQASGSAATNDLLCRFMLDGDKRRCWTCPTAIEPFAVCRILCRAL